MQWLRTWQQAPGCRRQTAVRRGLAGFLLLVLSASMLHVADATQATLAVSAAHEQMIAHDGGEEPCCPHQTRHAQDGACTSAAGCSLWVTVATASIFFLPEAESLQGEPATAPVGLLPFPHFHPPKLSARV
jgi:hypothetical protein